MSGVNNNNQAQKSLIAFDNGNILSQIEKDNGNSEVTFLYGNGDKFVGLNPKISADGILWDGDGIYIAQAGWKFKGRVKNDCPYEGEFYDIQDKLICSSRILPLKKGDDITIGDVKRGSDYKDNIFGNKKIRQLPNGDIQIGTISQNAFNGVCAILHPNGKIKYIGQVKNGVADGMGIWYYKNGSIYKGQVNENIEPDGQGKMNFPNGEYGVGRFEKGKFVEGVAKVTHANGEIYEGNIKNGQREGGGTLIKGRFSFKGNFKNDVEDGLFEVWKDGQYLIKCNFKNGILDPYIHNEKALISHRTLFGNYGFYLNQYFESQNNDQRNINLGIGFDNISTLVESDKEKLRNLCLGLKNDGRKKYLINPAKPPALAGVNIDVLHILQ